MIALPPREGLNGSFHRASFVFRVQGRVLKLIYIGDDLLEVV